RIESKCRPLWGGVAAYAGVANIGKEFCSIALRTCSSFDEVIIHYDDIMSERRALLPRFPKIAACFHERWLFLAGWSEYFGCLTTSYACGMPQPRMPEAGELYKVCEPIFGMGPHAPEFLDILERQDEVE